MKSVNLLLGIHNHQPVGNFEFVFEEAYQKAYRPFLEVLSAYPEIRIGMHFTGIVLDWLGRVYPEFLTDLKMLVERGQVEMIGGGFYEPIMAVIPDADKLGQIEKLSAFCESRLGQRPVGMWVAERVWEPHLPKPFHQAGMKYVILDDTHFKYAGLKEEELRGYFVTEEEGYKLAAFPISKRLRYMIPFQDPSKTIDYLKEAASENGENLVVFADDGEKFGIWPETYDHVYGKKWLSRFFDALMENKRWLKTMHFSEAMVRFKPAGRVYIPTASYAEMLHWALPSGPYRDYELFEDELKVTDPNGKFAAFVRGGFWRNFSTKYPEINRMHKKMLRLSKRLQMSKAAVLPMEVEKIALLEAAQDHLYASQCNCPYWHGVFGGVYLNNIRYAMFREMLLAEKFMDAADYGSNEQWYSVLKSDFDSDGLDEVLLETRGLDLYWSPEEGGSLFELDYKDVPINLGDSLRRREEGYHHKLLEDTTQPHSDDSSDDAIASIHDRVLSKEADLQKFLTYDDFPRHSFLDHFYPLTTTVDQLKMSRYHELGDFAGQPWAFEDRSQPGHVSLVFRRDGMVDHRSVVVEKVVILQPGASSFTVRYAVNNRSNRALKALFGTELNLTLLAGNAEDRYYFIEGRELNDCRLVSTGDHTRVSTFGMKDHWLGVHVRCEVDLPATVWWYPVETVSMSEEGFERVYQNSCIIPHWHVELQPGAVWNVLIKMSFSRSL